MKTAREKLIDYVLSLNEEQLQKVASKLDLLKRLATMTPSQIEYTDDLTAILFGGVAV